MTEYLFGRLAQPDEAAAYVRQQRRGVRHGGFISPGLPGPTDRPRVSVSLGLDVAIEKVVCSILAPETRQVLLERAAVQWDMLNWSYRQHWAGFLPAYPEGTLVRYRIDAFPASGDGPIAADEGALSSYVVGPFSPPDWAAEAIIYQIFPDRFHPGVGRSWQQTEEIEAVFGGSLRGVIENLSYLAEMGFNCLWLNPFHPDHTYHGYHITDHFGINPRLGTLDDVRELVEKAHALGIRLLLDFVPNHCGASHPHFQDAISRPDSPYRDWFYFNRWPDDYEMYYRVRDLPKINVDHPKARAYLIDSACYWLREVGFDGLRLDHAHGPTLDFWTGMRQAVARAKPDAWLFGEVTLPAPLQLVYEGRLHGCLDFHLAEALRRTFAFGSMSLAAFDAFLEQHEAFFPAHFSRPSFLDNHDMDRFLFIAGGDKRKLKLAALCHFTLTGPPIVYYGTEVGVPQERFINGPDGRGMAEARLPMLWADDQDQELRSFYRRLIQARREHPALWRGRRRRVHLDREAGTYAYLREDGLDRLLVAFNLSDQSRQIEFEGRLLALEAWQGDLVVLNQAA